MEKVFVVLLAAHLLADFLLQPGWLIARKHRNSFLLLHALIQAALSYLFLQAWSCWQLPLYIFLFHALIDFGKRNLKDTAAAFISDQLVHYATILVLAWGLIHFGIIPGFLGAGYILMVITAGFVATVKAAGFLVGKVTKTIIEENNIELSGLKNGGQWIGMLERALIFMFIFSDFPVGIGFLVVAKSILRFQEAKKSQMAEYVLIGTLLSFSLAIALAAATKWALGLH